MESSRNRLEEVQGLYGPFQFPELLLQRIWLEQTFSMTQARSQTGERIKIIHPGRWNRQAGPDFRQVELRIGDEIKRGDVELHLREQDWKAHQHAADPNYRDVVLHVVLFPTAATTTPGPEGRALPVLVLLPLLWHDLEEYAADAAVAHIADRPADRLAEAWLELSPAESRERIVAEARQRWRGKVRYARLRIEKLGWTDACHHTALEILGYRFNRTGMLWVASHHPLSAWLATDFDPEAVYQQFAERWQLGAVRPANHPRRRLASYATWVRLVPDWPSVLARQGEAWPALPPDLSAATDVADLRKGLGLKVHWQAVMSTIGVAEAVARPRADNLWGDGWLPLLAAAEAIDEEEAFVWWFASWPGDQTNRMATVARLSGLTDGRRNPLAWGHVQGLWGQQLARAMRCGEGDLTRDFTKG